MNLNNFIFIRGNLVKDAAKKTFNSGKTLTEITVAINHSKEESSFIDVKLWDDLEYMLTKGQQVAVNGWIKQESWTGKDGKKSSKLVIMASAISTISKQKKSVDTETGKVTSNSTILDDDGKELF